MSILSEGSDPEHVGLLKEVLRVIFGLEPNTIGKVVRAIKSSEDAANVKTNLVRSRIGARAMKYLRNATEIARHEGSEKHEKGKERDLEKETDLEPGQLEKEKARKAKEAEKGKKKTNEGFSFKDYLVTEREMTISVDPDDPVAAKKAIALARQNPDRATRQGVADAKDARAVAQKEGDPVATKLAALRMQIKQLEAKQARQSEREA